MVHGIAEYFIERGRCARRVSLLTLILGVVGFGGLMLTQIRPIRSMTRIDTARFGFEGPNQFVRRIILQSHQGPSPLLSDLGKVQPQSRGEGEGASAKGQRGGRPVVKMPVELGDGQSSYSPRSVGSFGSVPVVRSEDLVIDHMITPRYPEPLLDRNIEGKVTLQALVDTIGQVVQVQVLASTGEELFESAAQEAVLQCKFRPYRRGGAASEVYAVFRFSFRIY